MRLIDVTKALATDEQCLAYLEASRWPHGVRCPTCGAKEVSKITRTVDETKTRKEKKQNKRKQIYQCLEPTCKSQFSATNGTIFHDSHLPLNKWFMAIALLVDAKKSMSALQLSRHLACNYRTAWYLAHRIREAMTEGGYRFNRREDADLFEQTVTRLVAGKALPYAKLREENAFTPFVRPSQVCASSRASSRIASAARHLSIYQAQHQISAYLPSFPQLTTNTGLLFRDIELPVSIIPSGFASEAGLKVSNTRLCRWRTANCSRSVRPARQAGVSAFASPSLQEPRREPRLRQRRLETGTLEVQPGN